MTTRTVKWLSAFVVLIMLVVMVPQTASAEELPTVVITEDTVLTADLNAHVVIGADGITLDGAGYSIICDDIWKSGGDGISMIGRSGVTIKNCQVIGWFEIGIRLYESSHNKIINNTVDGSHYKGFYLLYSDNNTVTDNTAIRVGDEWGGGSPVGYGGFDVWGNSNVVTNNTAINIFGFGFRGNDLRGNTATGCWEGFYVGSSSYLEDNLAFECGKGFSMDECSESTLVNNTARNNSNGFVLFGYRIIVDKHGPTTCYHNLLVRNTAINNTYRGFSLQYADYNTFLYNVAHGNGDNLYKSILCWHSKFQHNDFDDKK